MSGRRPGAGRVRLRRWRCSQSRWLRRSVRPWRPAQRSVRRGARVWPKTDVSAESSRAASWQEEPSAPTLPRYCINLRGCHRLERAENWHPAPKAAPAAHTRTKQRRLRVAAAADARLRPVQASHAVVPTPTRELAAVAGQPHNPPAEPAPMRRAEENPDASAELAPPMPSRSDDRVTQTVARPSAGRAPGSPSGSALASSSKSCSSSFVADLVVCR